MCEMLGIPLPNLYQKEMHMNKNIQVSSTHNGGSADSSLFYAQKSVEYKLLQR